MKNPDKKRTVFSIVAPGTGDHARESPMRDVRDVCQVPGSP